MPRRNRRRPTFEWEEARKAWKRFMERDQPPVDGLGLASWSCHPRAHPVEQNGSPFLTATSGRSLPQHVQRPSRRGEGSARIGWLSNAGRRLSLAIVDGTVMAPPRSGDPLREAKVPGPASRILFASAPSSRARAARRQASGLSRGSGRRASYQESTPPGTARARRAMLRRPRSPGLEVEFVVLLALQADPVVVTGCACAQFRRHHRHATGGADRWTFLVHVRSIGPLLVASLLGPGGRHPDLLGCHQDSLAD
jgi:hypothetical protein